MITLIIILIVAGVALQFVKEYVEPKLYVAAIILIVLVIFLAVLSMFGLVHAPALR